MPTTAHYDTLDPKMKGFQQKDNLLGDLNKALGGKYNYQSAIDATKAKLRNREPEAKTLVEILSRYGITPDQMTNKDGSVRGIYLYTNPVAARDEKLAARVQLMFLQEWVESQPREHHNDPEESEEAKPATRHEEPEEAKPATRHEEPEEAKPAGQYPHMEVEEAKPATRHEEPAVKIEQPVEEEDETQRQLENMRKFYEEEMDRQKTQQQTELNKVRDELDQTKNAHATVEARNKDMRAKHSTLLVSYQELTDVLEQSKQQQPQHVTPQQSLMDSDEESFKSANSTPQKVIQIARPAVPVVALNAQGALAAVAPPVVVPPRLDVNSDSTLDIKEARLKDELASLRQVKIGRNPNVKTTIQAVNMAQILQQLRIKTQYRDAVNVRTLIPRPDFRNLRLVDPFV